MFQFIVVPLINSELSSSTQTAELTGLTLRYNWDTNVPLQPCDTTFTSVMKL